jgi:peptidoglycan/xylan/chitin deacetylase (PgdA/CDA1 family)
MILNPETVVNVGAGAASVLGLAAAGCAYAAYWPGSKLFGRALIAPHRAGEVALTFDDGPNPKCTPKLLETLAERGVRATFFLVGQYAAAEPALVRRIAEGGHAIGNHSWTHPNLAFCGEARIREELKRTSLELESITGQRVDLFRPPFGARRPAVFRIAKELGMRPVLWNVIVGDWSERSARTIAKRAISGVERMARRRRAANIVLHDGSHVRMGADRVPTVNAAELMLKRMRDTRQFVKLDVWG